MDWGCFQFVSTGTRRRASSRKKSSIVTPVKIPEPPAPLDVATLVTSAVTAALGPCLFGLVAAILGPTAPCGLLLGSVSIIVTMAVLLAHEGLISRVASSIVILCAIGMSPIAAVRYVPFAGDLDCVKRLGWASLWLLCSGGWVWTICGVREEQRIRDIWKYIGTDFIGPTVFSIFHTPILIGWVLGDTVGAALGSLPLCGLVWGGAAIEAHEKGLTTKGLILQGAPTFLFSTVYAAVPALCAHFVSTAGDVVCARRLAWAVLWGCGSALIWLLRCTGGARRILQIRERTAFVLELPAETLWSILFCTWPGAVGWVLGGSDGAAIGALLLVAVVLAACVGDPEKKSSLPWYMPRQLQELLAHATLASSPALAAWCMGW